MQLIHQLDIVASYRHVVVDDLMCAIAISLVADDERRPIDHRQSVRPTA